MSKIKTNYIHTASIFGLVIVGACIFGVLEVQAAPSFTAETSPGCGGVVSVSGTLDNGGWTTYLQVTDETNTTVYFGVGIGLITGTITGLVPDSSHTYRARVFNGWGMSSLFGPVTVTASAACADPEVNVNLQR